MVDCITIIHKDSDSDCGVSFPDFPGCITAGRTLEEAKDMAAEALSGHIEEMMAAGEKRSLISPARRGHGQPGFSATGSPFWSASRRAAKLCASTSR